MPTTTARAIRLHEFGGPEVLRDDEVPIPEPKAGEVLVRVHAVGVNPPDWYVREGMPDVPPELRPEMSLPMIPGTDVSGVVAALADDVDDFAVGDEVFGLLRFPDPEGGRAYAEYVAAPASDLARKPAGIDHVHAAAVPMAGLTAWQYLIELGRNRPEDIAHDLDLVLDAVGGPGSRRFLRTLRRGGALYPLYLAEYDPDEVAALGVTTSATQVRANGAQLAELGRLLDAGTVRVAIDSTFPLAEAWRAHARAARGHIQGKIVLTVA